MAFIVTSKTRRSSSWRKGRKAEIYKHTTGVERQNDKNAKAHQEKLVQEALRRNAQTKSDLP